MSNKKNESSKRLKRPLGRLLSYTRPHRLRIVLASIFSVLNKLFDLAPPALIGIAVDIVVKQESSWIASWGFPDPFQQLLVLGALTLIIWILESVFEYLFAIYWRNLAQMVQHDLRKDAYRHVQEMELAYFEDKSTGGLISILNDDINQLERFLDVGANDLIQVTTTVIVIGALFVVTAPEISWMALLPMPFIIWGSVKFQATLAPRYDAVRDKVGLLNSQLSNNLSGIATIKGFGTQEYENGRIEELSNQYRSANKKAIKLSSAYVPMIRMIIVAGFLAILIFGGQQTLSGELEVEIYSLLIFITQRLLWPLTSLGQTFDLYQRAMASTSRVLDLISNDEKLQDGFKSLEKSEVQGAYELKNVSFSYRTGPPVIKDLSLSIKPGETIGFVGATGAGKTSLIKLLMRFYDVSEGTILLDGHDIRELKLDDISKLNGLVSQDVYLFHGSVRDNIAYGTFDAEDEAIVKAAKLAEAHDFIKDLHQGYDTIVGERGQKLSGGQRQRISIARAILRDPPVLILDEATSAVDNETEAAIQRSLDHISHSRTTLVIAHRLSTIRHADRIYVLSQGMVREQGTHEELLAQKGIYEQLWKVQSGEALLHGN